MVQTGRTRAPAEASGSGRPLRPRLGPGAAERTFSSGSFHAGAPIMTLAPPSRRSHGYQTFPTKPPRTPVESRRRHRRRSSSSSSDSWSASALPSSRLSSLSSSTDSTDSSSDGAQTPLPVRQLLLLALLSLAEQTALNSIAPYLPGMVSSMPGVPPGQNGLYVGILASSFALAQLSTNLLWGWASDLVGRKPVLLAGTASLSACFAVFGLCRHFWHIVVVHVAMGLLNGNAACVPTVLGEVTDRSNQSKAFTYLPVIYSLGSITGPALGGLLVNRIFSRDYPYLAPNLCAAALLAFSVVVLAIWFEETLDQSGVGPWKPFWVTRLTSWLRLRRRQDSRRDSWTSRWARGRDGQQRPLLSHRRSSSADDNNDDDEVINGARDHNTATINPDDDEEFDKASNDGNEGVWRDLLNRTTVILLVTYLVFQLSNISFNSLYPIFAAAPPPTGRNLGPGKIGISLSVAGIATIIFQSFLFQPLQARTGNLGAYRFALLGIAVSMVLIPWVGYLDDDPPFGIGSGRWWLYAELGVVLVLKNICAVGGLSSVMLLITNSAPSHASLGTLNGVAQTLSALGRSFGPFVSGGLFTLSTHVRPKGEALAWSLFGGLALVGWVGSFFIRGAGLESGSWEDSDDEFEHSDTGDAA